MEIGDRIRAARRAAGWTQEQLAKAIGVNKSAVAQWEAPSTYRKGITTENLREVARVLQIDVGDLLRDDTGASELRTANPREIALVSLFRRMSPRQQDVHLELFYTSVGLAEGEQVQSNPPKRRRGAA